MSNIHDLLNQLAGAETQLQAAQFLAPCVRGGKVRTRLQGLVYTFTPRPQDFQGWGIFQPQDAQTAILVEPADLPEITTYLQNFPVLRLRLIYKLRGKTWLAYPVNEADMQQRFQAARPVPVHLVTEGVAFESIVARWQGPSCWFEAVDRRADPEPSEHLQAALKQLVPTEELQFKGITPEMRTAYELVANKTAGFAQPQRDEHQLRRALAQGGGQLQQFQDRGDYWTVDWTTADGIRHSSAIAKADLTVISSGICLSGRDRDFDLQSLVGVMEQQD
jgi:hypothetical protein